MKLRWTLNARDDLRRIRSYIGRDKRDDAQRWIRGLRERARGAASMPRSGRVVPEFDRDGARVPTCVSRESAVNAAHQAEDQMIKIVMKPETIRRRAIEHAAERKTSRANLLRRLRENVERDGPDSIWAELLERETSFPYADAVAAAGKTDE